MARRKDPSAVVMDYFETAPIEAAVAVLGIVKGIVVKRQPVKKTPRAPRQVAADEAPGIAPKA